MLVTQVCQANELQFIRGLTIAYTSCYFWNNILDCKSPAKQLFGVEMRSEADYEYLLDLNQVNSLWRLWKGNSVFVVNNSEL